jgi:diguanylate cyclase (GGDEF)-like protein
MRTGNISFRRQHMLTVIILGVLFLAVTFSGFFATITATNKVEQQRTMRLAEAAVKSQMGALGSIAEDNALWDEAAQEVYDKPEAKAFFERNWADYTVDNPNFEMAALIDEKQNLLAAAEYGEPVALNISQHFGPAASRAIKKLSVRHPSTQILVRDEQGVSVLAASVVRFTDDIDNVRNIGSKPKILLLKKHLNAELIQKLASQYSVGGLKVHLKPVGKDSQALRDGNGTILGYLTWNSPTGGFAAASDSLPVLLVGSLLFAIALAFGSQAGLNLINYLARQALTDSLSDMPNRRALRNAIRQEQDNNSTHALALIDLDGFKSVNDRYGHAVGDRLIRKVSAMLKQLIADEGLIARLGGDEFAILLNNSDAPRRIQVIANQVLEKLQMPVIVEDRSLTIGASIGLASTSEPLKDEGELLRRADIAMYEAKRLGKMRLHWYDPQLDEEQSIADALASELRHSLSTGDISVVYQPIVEVDDQRCRSVEALARWTSPTRGPIPPKTFIPIAENTGLIDAIGLLVLRRACTDLSAWPDIGLAVNVSAAQLRNPAFPDQLRAILAATGFEPRRLELEITETYLIADASLAQRVIEGITALGITISLDDFGTGYASIGFLRQFEFAKLKIDRSLVKDAQFDEAARMLVQVSVAAARALKMVVTAEGVETSAQAALMKIAGCDQLQGWYFGKPVEYAALADLLGKTREQATSIA